jgi:hypothetical protein
MFSKKVLKRRCISLFYHQRAIFVSFYLFFMKEIKIDESHLDGKKQHDLGAKHFYLENIALEITL